MLISGLRGKSNVTRCLLNALWNASCELIMWVNEEGRHLRHRLRIHVCWTGFLFNRHRRAWLL